VELCKPWSLVVSERLFGGVNGLASPIALAETIAAASTGGVRKGWDAPKERVGCYSTATAHSADSTSSDSTCSGPGRGFSATNKAPSLSE